MKKTRTSNYKGVSAHGNKWIATAYNNKKTYYLGIFDTQEEANQAVLYAKANNDYSNRSGYKEKATSKYRGVAKVGKRFMVSKTINHKQFYVGTYESEELAVKVLELVQTEEDVLKYRNYKG